MHMGNLDVRGTVVYMPGTWGPALGVGNATVELIDVDLPGKGDDLIFTGQANSQGYFAGTTSEWHDTAERWVLVTDSVFPPRAHFEKRSEPDVTDVLALKARITEHRADGDRRAELIFPFLGNGAPAPVLMVPWGPPPRPPVEVISINGQGFADPGLAVAHVKAIADSHQRITIAVRDAALRDALSSLAGASRDQLIALMRQRLNLPALPLNGVTGADDVILALAVLATAIAAGLAINIIATATAVFVIVLAFAIVYALYQGYKHFHIALKNNPNTGQNELEVTIDQ
jgi:hypothetical protein